MKRIDIWTTAIIFAGTLGSIPAQATSASTAPHKRSLEVTGCLKQGPTAKEYLIQSSDGSLWGIRETDMLMNNYLNHEVTIAGDVMHATASDQAAGGAHHFLRAYDVVVESNSCRK